MWSLRRSSSSSLLFLAALVVCSGDHVGFGGDLGNASSNGMLYIRYLPARGLSCARSSWPNLFFFVKPMSSTLVYLPGRANVDEGAQGSPGILELNAFL